ncbi:MAG: DUF106 domain-containing protein [Candidatus Thorarchaeota archaeon]|nr:MAG: DUF106 domain-containing protein [Candidatus Thorarchaeota archaeon]
MDLLGDIILALQMPPMSAPFIVLVSVLLALISVWATKRFTNIEETEAKMAEIRRWREEFNEARRTMNQLMLEKLMAEQSRIMKLNTEIMSDRCRPMCYTYIPIAAIFIALLNFYALLPVAILPFNPQKLLPILDGWLGMTLPNGGFGLFFWPWYLISSIGLGNLVRRAFGITATM